jgi:phosphatidylinositol alpha-mannosyltransferase
MAPIAPDLPAALRTIRALRDEAFDVVHLHEPLAPGPTLTALVFSVAPLVGTFHRAGVAGWYRAVRPLCAWGLGHLAVRAAVSAEAQASIASLFGGTYELLWNGIDVDRYQRLERPRTAEPTIFFVGRHEPRKGLAVLIEAMSDLPAHVHLWVAGQGPETARLRQATIDDERVEWLGAIPEVDKIRRLREAHVLCAPSLSGESFGMVLLEGLASGTPVVATDLVGYRSVARADHEALLVPPADPHALAGALSTALEHGPEVADMVANGQVRAATFSLDRLAERYCELYEKAIANKAAAPSFRAASTPSPSPPQGDQPERPAGR